jgi:DNA repair photolyase
VFVGCVQQYCYCREKKYYPFEDPRDFAYRIEVKENAPDLLRRALSRAPVDTVGTGDYQAAERKFGLSRQVLQVCLDLGFPVSVLERSTLVLRDLDLLKEINERARTVMMWSIIYTPDSAHRSTLRQLERLAPPPEKRFAAMEQMARAGILTGTCLMPTLPDLPRRGHGGEPGGGRAPDGRARQAPCAGRRSDDGRSAAGLLRRDPGSAFSSAGIALQHAGSSGQLWADPERLAADGPAR